MKLVIPASLASAEDVREAGDELHHALTTKTGMSSLSDGARDLLKVAGCSLNDGDAVNGLVKSLKDLYASAPRVSVTLAAPADPATKKALTAWFRENTSPTALVSFGFNRAILGGVLVRAGSRIYDWSYRSKLLDSKLNFTEVLERV